MAVQRTRDIEIDPMFHVPPHVIDVRQENKENGEFYYTNETVAKPGPTLATPTSSIPMPPSSYQIVDQAVRIGSDGRAVVDVTIEFPDTPGLFNIDVAVTPA